MKQIISFFSMLLLFSNTLLAQDEGGLMRSNGKLYVVAAVVVTIFIGIVLFMISVERRLNRVERDMDL